jgi:hypothetical protein
LPPPQELLTCAAPKIEKARPSNDLKNTFAILKQHQVWSLTDKNQRKIATDRYSNVPTYVIVTAKGIFKKVIWMGRTTSTVFGVASAAFGANGDFFTVGRNNLAGVISMLTKSGAGPALRLKVDSGPPLAVNSETKVDKLNADKLDDQDAEDLKPLLADIQSDGTPNTKSALQNPIW